MTPSAKLTKDSIWFLSGQVEESGPTREISIKTAPFRVGRNPDLNLSLPCLTVSKVHAEILDEGDALWVRDLGSTNGTYINGQRVSTEAILHQGDLLQFGNVIFAVGRVETRQDTATIQADACDKALVLIQFDKLMSNRAVVPFYQPIVGISDRKTIGFEVLGRSRLFGVNTPSAMFLAASQLNLEAELSRMLRVEGVEASAEMPGNPHLFLNTHPVELANPGLLESLSELREVYRSVPITLEIHEAAVARASTMKELHAALRGLNIGLAYDDFGAGQSRLLELIDVPPDFLKFDIKLVQGIHSASTQRRQMLRTLVQMVRELDIVPLAEGVECADESDVCEELGFELGQGFYYAKPAPITQWKGGDSSASTDLGTDTDTDPSIPLRP